MRCQKAYKTDLPCRVPVRCSEHEHCGIPANPQVFGRLLLDARFEGVVYPSTKGSENCVALFPASFARSESFVEVADEGPPYAGKLRLDSSTWQDIGAPGPTKSAWH